MARLKEQYKAEVAPALMKQFGYKSVMQIPKIDKVVINVGCGEARENAKTAMAKTSMKIKQARPAKFSTRKYNRCKLCGRPHAYLRNYGVCRICFRELAYKGEIPGVRKASF